MELNIYPDSTGGSPGSCSRLGVPIPTGSIRRAGLPMALRAPASPASSHGTCRLASAPAPAPGQNVTWPWFELKVVLSLLLLSGFEFALLVLKKLVHTKPWSCQWRRVVVVERSVVPPGPFLFQSGYPGDNCRNVDQCHLLVTMVYASSDNRAWLWNELPVTPLNLCNVLMSAQADWQVVLVIA
jgi:hypothetical protein